MKEIIKESEKRLLLVDIMLYIIYAVSGYVLLVYPEIEVLQPIKYASLLFYSFGFFSLVAYFVNRRLNDYEFLLLGLVNILAGSFVLFYSYYSDTSFILGNALLIYSIAMVLNKGWHTIKLSRENNINMFPKFAITILITLLGILVITNLYRETTMQTLVLGFYFICFGILSLFETIMLIVMKNKHVRKYLTELLGENEIKEKIIIKDIKHHTLKMNAIENKKNNIPANNKVKNIGNIKSNKTKKINNNKLNDKKVIKQPMNKKKKSNK